MAREEIICGLRTLLAGGSDREGGGEGPLVCLLHGYGASGDDLSGLWRVLDVPRQVRFAFPQAPLSLQQLFGFPAYAWWHVDIERMNVRLSRARTEAELQEVLQEIMDGEPSGLPEARQQVLDWLAALRQRLAVPAGRTVLGGFSQGAMLATDMALHLRDPADLPAGLLQLSGALIDRPKWQALLGSAEPIPRFQSHGLEDAILPFVLGQALHEFLRQRWPGTFYRFHGGHEIPPGAIDAIGAAITAWVGSA